MLGDAKAELEKLKFRRVEYEIDNDFLFSIRFGDYFYYNDPQIVTYTDNGSNTVKLVARSVEYNLLDSGLRCKVNGVRRFT